MAFIDPGFGPSGVGRRRIREKGRDLLAQGGLIGLHRQQIVGSGIANCPRDPAVARDRIDGDHRAGQASLSTRRSSTGGMAVTSPLLSATCGVTFFHRSRQGRIDPASQLDTHPGLLVIALLCSLIVHSFEIRTFCTVEQIDKVDDGAWFHRPVRFSCPRSHTGRINMSKDNKSAAVTGQPALAHPLSSDDTFPVAISAVTACC